MNVSQNAAELVAALARHQVRLVLAESCTGGRIAAELTRIAGVSDWFCGSVVSYRNDSKVRWLGVDSIVIEQQTAVCAEVARQMAVGVLQRTPEADWAASVTGHLGPDAPDGFDGLVFIGAANRTGTTIDVDVWRCQLTSSGRDARQRESCERVLERLLARLSGA